MLHRRHSFLLRYLALSSAIGFVIVPVALGASAAHSYARSDLPKVVAPLPPANDEWLDVTTSDGDPRAFGLSYFEEKPLITAMRRAGFRMGYKRAWSAQAIQPYDYRTAEADALLFRTAAGALAGLNALKHSVSRAPTLRWPELGGGSFGWAVLGKMPSVLYEWRIGNLVLVANAYCDVECQFDDVVPVTRAYAHTLDKTAKGIG